MRFLVTGAYGCIGAWTTAELVRDGNDVVTFDLSTDPRRLRLVLDDDVPHIAGDITDREEVERASDGGTHVVHPRNKRDPPRAAAGPVRAGNPAARRAGQRARHGQRLRGGAEARAAGRV